MSAAVVVDVVIFWIASAIFGSVIRSQKDAPSVDVSLGIILGPLGLIAALAIDGRSMCPRCKRRLNGQTTECPHCHLMIAWIRIVSGNPVPGPAAKLEGFQSRSLP